MSDDKTLNELADLFGILPSFRDLSGTERPTSNETKIALLRANGLAVDTPAMVTEALQTQRGLMRGRIAPEEVIVSCRTRSRIDVTAPCEWALELEADAPTNVEGRGKHCIDLPPLPSGIHTLSLQHKGGAERVTIIAAPERAPSVTKTAGQPRIWGVNTALYGLHSAAKRDVGSYEDLASAAESIATHGAGFLGINPVHAMGWADKVTVSPYSPSHRGYLNMSHISTNHVLGLTEDLDNQDALSSSMINYAGHRQMQHTALEAAFSKFGSLAHLDAKAAFETFRQDGGEPLQRFALFETISEEHGPDWRVWPKELHSPERAAARHIAAIKSERVVFHSWLQWLADQQLGDAQLRARAAGMVPGLYLDLAVGSRRGAAETWCERGSVASGVSIGAPPDHLSPAGQNWDLAAFAPTRLKQTQYRAFRDILSRSMRHAGILRIDHVLGLNRSYWIPDDGSPGGYIRQPFEALLAVIAIEANKTGTVIVGEDLGLVPEGFRDRLQERGLYSYSVLQYEKDKHGSFTSPDQLRPDSLTCFGTHDTPTLKGYLRERDIDWWRKLNWIDNQSEAALRKTRKGEVDALLALNPLNAATTQTLFRQLSHSVHEALAQSPVSMVSVQLDDAFGEIEAQNLPGTIHYHPNWRRRVSQPVEGFGKHSGLERIGKQMQAAGRAVSNRSEYEN